MPATVPVPTPRPSTATAAELRARLVAHLGRLGFAPLAAQPETALWRRGELVVTVPRACTCATPSDRMALVQVPSAIQDIGQRLGIAGGALLAQIAA